MSLTPTATATDPTTAYSPIFQIENVSVSLKYKNVSVSHKIVIWRNLLRRGDQGGQTMVSDGPNWCLADCMLRNYYQTLSKTAKTGVIKYFVTNRHLLCDQQTIGKFI